MVSLGFRDRNQRYNHVCDGVIISDGFVLSVLDCLTPTINLVHLTHNNFTHMDSYSQDTSFYGIKRRIVSRYSGAIVFLGNNAIIELNSTMRFDENFKPACLWTNNFLDVTELKSVGWYHSTFDTQFGDLTDFYLMETPSAVVSKDKCNNFNEYKTFFPSGLLNSELFCVEHTLDDESEWIQASHPIQIRKPNNYYVFGVFTMRLNFSPKILINILSEIDWIESIVWYGNQTGESPTLKISKPNLSSSPVTFFEPRELDPPTSVTTTKTPKPEVTLQCGERKVKHKAYITYSSPTYHGEFPWHVALNQRETSIRKNYICGGSILTKMIVLTGKYVLEKL